MKVLKNFISHALSYHEVHPSKLVKSRVLKKKGGGIQEADFTAKGRRWQRQTPNSVQ